MKRAIVAGALMAAVTLTGCQHAWTPPPSTLPTPVYSVIDLAPPSADPAVAAAQAAPAPKAAAGAHAAVPHLGGGGGGGGGGGLPGGGIGRAFGNLNLGGGKNNGG